MANANDDEQSAARRLDELKEHDRRLNRMHKIMDRFEEIGYRRATIFSVDEAIEWWQAYKPRTVRTEEL